IAVSSFINTAFSRATTWVSPFILVLPCLQAGIDRQLDDAACDGAHASRASVSTNRDFAHDVQRPQPRPTPRLCARSSDERAPCSVALTMSRSVMALQRQMYMRTYLKISYAARLLCRFLARPSMYVLVLSRDSLRAFAYSACSPHFEISSSRFLIGLTSRVAQTRGVDPHHSSRQMDLAQEREQSADQRNPR